MTATLTAPIQVIAACADEVRSSLSELDDGAMLDLVRGMESASRIVHSVMLDVLAEVDSRRLAAQAGFRSTAALVGDLVHLSRTEARLRAEQASKLGAHRGLTGQSLAPELPETAAALAAGEIGPAHTRIITEIMDAVPASVTAAQRTQAEADLARYARTFGPTELAKLGQRVLAHLDPDGPEPRDDDPAPAAGEFRLHNRRDGKLGFEGWLDGEHGPQFQGLIEQLAKPRPLSEDLPDQRSTDERQADALLELCGLARAAQECPTTGGEPPHVTVTIDWNALRAELGAALLDYGQHLGASGARRWACDCKIVPIVLGGESEPLDVGRISRTVPLGIRRALVARDRGCAFPGCDRPPSRCDAHHVRHWADGGDTSLCNCVLLCPTHHRHVHGTGWEIIVKPGHVEFVPPAILDPLRKPLRNLLRC
ncbi:MAG: HNH endonuclease [Actinobacteria bacterium]|nr:HNH endonuclease [Actinomycetota bacterium]